MQWKSIRVPLLERFGILSALAVFLVVAGTGCRATRDFVPESLIPATATTLGSMNVRVVLERGRGSWYDQALEDLDTNPDYAKLRDEIGLDPIRDIDRILVGAGPDAELGQVVAVLEGRFQPEQIIDGLKLQPGYATETIHGTTIHYLAAEDGNRYGFFFPAAGHAVAVGEVWAAAALDAFQGERQDIRSNEDVQSLRDHIDVSDPFWMVGQIPQEMVAQSPANMLGPMLGDLQAFMISGDVDETNGMHLVTMVRAGRPSSAANLKAMASMAVEAGKVAVATDYPALSRALGRIQLTADGNTAKLEMQVDGDLMKEARSELDRLRTRLPQSRAGSDETVDEEPWEGDFYDDEDEEAPSGGESSPTTSF